MWCNIVHIFCILLFGSRPGEFDITFKHYPGGVCSPYLHSIKVGEEINVYRVGERTRHPGTFVGVVAFGVGITAALPIACEELEKGDAKKVVLLWSSRTMQDTFWADRVAEMKVRCCTSVYQCNGVPGNVQRATCVELVAGSWWLVAQARPKRRLFGRGIQK